MKVSLYHESCHVLVWYGKSKYGYGKPLCFLKSLGREYKKGVTPLSHPTLSKTRKKECLCISKVFMSDYGSLPWKLKTSFKSCGKSPFLLVNKRKVVCVWDKEQVVNEEIE